MSEKSFLGLSWLHFLVLSSTLTITVVNSSVILDDNVDQQGLYSKSDGVTILTRANFDRKIYGKNYAQLVQFYNSYCGHCRKFYPKFKSLAHEVAPWKKVFKLAVIDCFNEENNEVCRDFEVMSYPSLRYMHENFFKGNGNVGERLHVAETVDNVKSQIIFKMHHEQQLGRFSIAPPLSIASYATYAEALNDVPKTVRFTFLVFEDANSTIGSELILDTSEYIQVKVKRVYENSEVAEITKMSRFPGIVALGPTITPAQFTPDNPTKQNLLQIIKTFLKSHNYIVPQDQKEDDIVPTEIPDHNSPSDSANRVYYSDLQKTIKSILHTEINRQNLDSEAKQALINLLKVLRDYFPFKGNERLKNYLEELLYNVHVSSGDAKELSETVRSLESKHKPYVSIASDYIGCKGSQPQYRGYTCGLWTLFHTLTVNAAPKGGDGGPRVLQALHGFVKHFFGCTDCVQHFLAMAERNRLFDVKDNDKSVLWLWVSHNEVNLRLAGDITEDPTHRKIQFPSVTQCPHCRMKIGAWNLPEVYQFLLSYYGSANIQDSNSGKSGASSMTQLSNLDLGMLSFLYILSFIIIILALKFFLTRRLNRKRFYKHGRGKV